MSMKAFSFVTALSIYMDPIHVYRATRCLCSAGFQVKRLWERAAFLVKRNIAMKDCLTTLKALKPIFGHWVAELGQIAAHAETLQNMLKRGLQDPVLSDVEAFGRDLSSSTVSTYL